MSDVPTPGVAQVAQHRGTFYLCFSKDTDPERARELFRHRFGTDPQHVCVDAGLLKAGPVPKGQHR